MMNEPAVATASPLASRIALDVLAEGGSAADALVAAQAVLTLVEPNASGLGGGAVILWYDARTGESGFIDGLSAAPALVTAHIEIDFDGRSVPSERSMMGGWSAGVPGAIRAIERFHGRYGRRPWAALLAPAIGLAEEGTGMPAYLRRTLLENPVMRHEPMARALYLDDEGEPLPVGTRFRNPALAATLRRLADEGPGALYEGPIARAIADAIAYDVLPGGVTEADLAGYRAVDRDPLAARLGAETLLTAPPPVFGGLVAAQTVSLMTELGRLGRDPVADVETIHLLMECGRLGFADRGTYVGDPDFVDSPAAALLDPGYIAERARLIDPLSALRKVRAGDIGAPAAPPGAGASGSHTTHLCVADGHGLSVAMTSTLNQNFGAKLSVAGFYLNNVMTNFARIPAPGGRAARNALAPGKRAITSIAPTLLLDPTGHPRAILGAAGGNRIPGTVTNALLRIAAGGTDPQAIVAAPHAMHYGVGSDLEPPLRAFAAEVRARGHHPMLRRLDGCSTNLLLRDGGRWRAGVDPRRDGRAEPR